MHHALDSLVRHHQYADYVFIWASRCLKQWFLIGGRQQIFGGGRDLLRAPQHGRFDQLIYQYAVQLI